MESNNNADEDFVAIRPEWTTVDRILACRYGSRNIWQYLRSKWKLFFLLCHFDFCYAKSLIRIGLEGTSEFDLVC